MDDEFLVVAGRSNRPTVELNRGREHESIVIVGVFADQIDPARGPVNLCGRPKAGTESVKKLARSFQGAVLLQICFTPSPAICGRQIGLSPPSDLEGKTYYTQCARKKMARPERFELPTFWFVAKRAQKSKCCSWCRIRQERATNLTLELDRSCLVWAGCGIGVK